MTAAAAPYLSLGAGVQSSTLLLLALHGRIPTFDAAIFADTGWEPAAVYTHLDRLRRLAAAGGIPIVRVSTGDIRADALNPAHRFASMPLFTLGPDGAQGMARRQWHQRIQDPADQGGGPPPARLPASGADPAGVQAEMAIGISVDEVHRARIADVAYMRNVFPLLDLRWRRTDCAAYLAEHGLGSTPRSACLGCPYHTDTEWLRLREQSPAEWADTVAFDAQIRHGSARATADGHPLRGQFFLHRQRIPLDQVVLRPRETPENPSGCGPWTCPHPSEQPDEPADEPVRASEREGRE